MTKMSGQWSQSITLWLTFLWAATSHAATPQYPYHLASVHATSYHTAITTADLKKPLTMSRLHMLLSKDNSLLDRKRLEKLIIIYATQLTPVQLPYKQVETLVEGQLRQWHQEGMGAEEIKKEWGVKTMQEVRKKLKDKFKKHLLCDTFLERLLLESPPSPAQVEDFYDLYIAPRAPKVPLKVVLVQLAFYPKNGGSLEEARQYMEGLYDNLSHIKSPQESIEVFCATIRQHIRSSPHPFTYSLLFNQHNTAQLTLEELPQDLQQELRTTDITLGMVSAPTLFVNEHGIQGVRILFVQACILPHRLNLADDYDYIKLLWLQFHQEVNLKTWWELHEKETEVYGSR